MKRIFKYPLKIQGEFSIEIPRGGSILTVQMQGGYPQMWVMIDETEEKDTRHFRIYGTGHEINDDFMHIYLGTVQDPNDWGILIWHIFEVIKS